MNRRSRNLPRNEGEENERKEKEKHSAEITILLTIVNFVAIGMVHSFSIFARYTPLDDECARTNFSSNHWPVDACSNNCTASDLKLNESEVITIATSYHMICDRQVMADLLDWTVMGGMLTGSIIGGQFFDFNGRKIAVIVSALVGGLGVISSIVLDTGYILVYLFLFTQALLVQGIEIGCYLLCLEQMPSEKRVLANSSLLCARALGFCLMSLANGLTNHWQWDVFIVSTIIGIGAYLFSKNSESRLHYDTTKKIINSRGKYKAVKNVRRYPGLTDNLERLFFPGDAFMRNNLLWLWFTSAMVYHSLVVAPAGRLTESRHWNVALSGAFEIAVCFLMHCFVKRKRRVQPLIYAQILAGVAVLVLGSLAATPKDTYAVLKVVMAHAGKLANIAVFYLLRMMTIEIFPTVMRGCGLGLCIFFQVLGGFATTALGTSARIETHLPMVLVGLMSLGALYCAAHMPETGDMILMDLLKEDATPFVMNKDSELNDETVNGAESDEIVFSEDGQREEVASGTASAAAAAPPTSGEDSPV